MRSALKIIVRLFFSLPLIIRNILYEFAFSGEQASLYEGGKDLVDKGYCVFQKRLDESLIHKLRQDFRQLEKVNPPESSGQQAGRVYHHGSISELAQIFVDKYRPMAEAYFGSSNIRCELTMYQRSWPITDAENVPGGLFHVDDNKRNLKFFIYLTDVDSEHGPFCYVPKTHKFRGLVTLARWWLWEVFRARVFLYGFLIDYAKLEKRSVAIVGKSGLCFCADTTGYHRAIPLHVGEREVFVVSFTRNMLINL